MSLAPKAFLALSMSDSWFSFWLPENMSPACWVHDFCELGWAVDAPD